MITVIKETLTVAGFIFSMILAVEYLNILSRGAWQRRLLGGGFRQYPISALLGVIPGCLGGFVVATLYSHRIVTPGALMSSMVATTGDAAFLMLALFPAAALKLFAGLFILGLLTGWLTDAALKVFRKSSANPPPRDLYDVHEADLTGGGWRELSLQRTALILILMFMIAGVLTGKIGGQAWDPDKVTLLVLCCLDLLMVFTASEHFLEKHLWDHAVRKHMPQVLFWTFAALLFIHFAVENNLQVEQWIKDSRYAVLLIACLVGLIPDASPQLIFVSLFSRGDVSWAVLVANAIVQDGHGTLPLLAHSRKAFFAVKGLKFLLGLAAGSVALMIQGPPS